MGRNIRSGLPFAVGSALERRRRTPRTATAWTALGLLSGLLFWESLGQPGSSLAFHPSQPACSSRPGWGLRRQLRSSFLGMTTPSGCAATTGESEGVESFEGVEDIGAQAQSRLAQIQAAMRRGEAKAAMQGTGVQEEPSRSRQMTPEEELLLKQLMVQPVEPEEQDLPGAEGGAEGVLNNLGILSQALEFRIEKTLEFCPDGKLAREILKEIRASGQQPSAKAYEAVLEAFSKKGDLDAALALFKEMIEAGVPATDNSYDLLAKPASRGGEFRFVEMLYAAKSKDRDGEIGAKSLGLLIDAYANALPRQPTRAEAAFRGAMAGADEQSIAPAEAAPDNVLKALKRAVGLQKFDELQTEYGLNFDSKFDELQTEDGLDFDSVSDL